MLAVDGKVNESVGGSDSPGKDDNRTLTFEEAILCVRTVHDRIVGVCDCRLFVSVCREKAQLY